MTRLPNIYDTLAKEFHITREFAKRCVHRTLYSPEWPDAETTLFRARLRELLLQRAMIAQLEAHDLCAQTCAQTDPSVPHPATLS